MSCAVTGDKFPVTRNKVPVSKMIFLVRDNSFLLNFWSSFRCITFSRQMCGIIVKILCFRIRLAKSDSDWFCPSRNKEASHSPKPPGLNNFSYFDGDVLLPNREPLLKKNSFSMVTSIKYWNKPLSYWMIRSLGRQGRVLQSWISNIQ